MAQRNPMNERYQGDGPQGKTRKSAAKLKPKAEAASSVHIAMKPTTKQERKAAHKKRDAQLAAKEAERRRKAEERERQARIAAGEEVEEPKQAGVLDKVKRFLIPDPPSSTKSTGPAGSGSTAAKSANASPPARPKGPDTPQYRRLKKIYWVLMGIGIVAIVSSFVINFSDPAFMDGMGMMVPMGVAYVAVISAIVLDYAKIRKLQKAHQKEISGSKGSPKQQKHEAQKKEAAALLEESRKAQKELKRANSKLPFRRSKPKEDADPGELAISEKTEEQP
ncbi:MAG: hypothetical protein LBL23_08790 [Coriobacteriales bacterium]|jgi:hypothetical protein|nr:hypothetical protein [Coriobacteriales bacterium]